MPKGPPYVPQTAQLGGTPTVSVDVPVSAVLLFLFAVGAVTHMATLQINRKRDHKFVFSGLIFGFCMARITALTMRMVWATHQTNVSIAIAASILTQAGVLLLFIVNIFFAQRILRALHPKFGWNRIVSLTFRILYFCIVALLVMVITASVQMFFTLDQGIRSRDRTIQLFATTFLAALAFLPIPLVLLSLLLARRGPVNDNFGHGRFRTKVFLLLFTSTLLALGAGFRAGVNYDIRPRTNPGWINHKACYYCFNYAIELIVIFTYAAFRFDRRFHVPDGSHAPGHYANGAGSEKGRRFSDSVNREADVFGPDEPERV